MKTLQEAITELAARITNQANHIAKTAVNPQQLFTVDYLLQTANQQAANLVDMYGIEQSEVMFQPKS